MSIFASEQIGAAACVSFSLLFSFVKVISVPSYKS